MAYQACYDYFLQIIYFGFGFNPDFDTSKEYKELLKNGCRKNDLISKEIHGENIIERTDSQFTTNISNHRKHNPSFDAFYKQYCRYDGFKSDKQYGISSWANCIKHQGGFITKELFDSELNSHLSFYSNDSSLSFSTEELYAHKPTTHEAVERLIKQNEKIVEISEWMFEQFFPKRRIEAFQTRPLPVENQILS